MDFFFIEGYATHPYGSAYQKGTSEDLKIGELARESMESVQTKILRARGLVRNILRLSGDSHGRVSSAFSKEQVVVVREVLGKLSKAPGNQNIKAILNDLDISAETATMKDLQRLNKRLCNQLSEEQIGTLDFPILSVERYEEMERLVQGNYDEATLVLWNQVVTKLPFQLQIDLPFLPELENIDAIRAWMANPENRVHFQGINNLNLEDKNLKVIPKEIMFLPQLRELSFFTNQIADLHPLRNCNHLEFLTLSRNRIVDLSPLQNLNRLQSLFIHSNRVEDLSPLQNLPQLDFLSLAWNPIADISRWVQESSAP